MKRMNRRISGLLVTFVLFVASVAVALQPGLPSKTAVWAAAARALGSKNAVCLLPLPAPRTPAWLAPCR